MKTLILVAILWTGVARAADCVFSGQEGFTVITQKIDAHTFIMAHDDVIAILKPSPKTKVYPGVFRMAIKWIDTRTVTMADGFTLPARVYEECGTLEGEFPNYTIKETKKTKRATKTNKEVAPADK